MVDLIKRIVESILEAKKLTDKAIGTVQTVSPININLENNNRLDLDEDDVIFLSTVNPDYLEVGDRLLMLRVNNGQEFIVLDKMR